MSSGLFKNVIFKMCLEIIYLIYVWKGFGIKWPTKVDVIKPNQVWYRGKYQESELLKKKS